MFPLSKLSKAVADDAKRQAPQQIDKLLLFIRFSALCSVTTVKWRIKNFSVTLGNSSSETTTIRILSKLDSSPKKNTKRRRSKSVTMNNEKEEPHFSPKISGNWSKRESGMSCVVRPRKNNFKLPVNVCTSCFSKNCHIVSLRMFNLSFIRFFTNSIEFLFPDAR